MLKIKFILLLFFMSHQLYSIAQTTLKPPTKINDVFFEYITTSLELKADDAVLVRPLVKKYLIDRKKIIANVSDPLDREQQILALKVIFRKQMADIIGMQKANAFFTQEQVFRRRAREELKQRKSNANN